jgi:hypothetical protein
MSETKQTIEMARGEGKWIRFTVTRDGLPIDITDKSCSFMAAETYDSDYVLSKSDPDFDKSLGLSGIARMNITSGESLALTAKTYMAEFRVVISGEGGQDVDIRRNIDLKIRESLFA